MRDSPKIVSWVAVVLVLGCQPAFSLTQRVANTTLAMPQDPGSGESFGYTYEDAFPGLFFDNALVIASPPGETNRLFLAEQGGVVQVITNLADPEVDTFLDLSVRVDDSHNEEGLLGLAFHPDYASNGYFYVFYTGYETVTGSYDVVSRFSVSSTNSNQGDDSSEVFMFRQFDQDGNHNGGDIAFGPDGFLYIALGDEGSGNDNQNNSQTITKDLFAGIVRIDVDLRTNSIAPNWHPANDGPATNYAIPPDNPFVGATNFNGTNISPSDVRTEFYAIGLRNPWRIVFDDVTGDLYCGDVGQGAREEISLIERGGNYGWAFREGAIAGPKGQPTGVTNVIDPILDYERTTQPGDDDFQGETVIGGLVFRGDRFPELVGHYLFGDNRRGHIWSFLKDGTNATQWQKLTTAPTFGLAAFGKDPRNGDVLFSDISFNRIRRLVRDTGSTSNTLPLTLSDAGVFADIESLAPHDGIVPYDINLPFWSDHAIKTRWFSIPDTNLVMTFDAEAPWTFPTGTVWIKHFDLETTSGVPSSVRRLETRILVKNEGGAYGATYRWGTSTTNATLVAEDGLEEDILVVRDGVVVTQTWVYPSRSDCLACHQPDPGFALGFNTVQLNRDYAYTNCSIITNQLRAYSTSGYFASEVSSYHTLRALVRPTNVMYSVGARARSYLQANCRQCHFDGSGAGSWDGDYFTPLSDAQIVDAAVQDDFGDPNYRVMSPGIQSNSMMLYRISNNDQHRMPPLGSTVLDTQGISLVSAWIGSLAGYETFAEWQVRHFGSTGHPDAVSGADPDGDGAFNDLEFLTSTDPTSAVPDGIGFSGTMTDDGHYRVSFDRIANVGFTLVWSTNLLNSEGWMLLDAPGNAPGLSASNFVDSVVDPEGTLPRKYYRLELYEP